MIHGYNDFIITQNCIHFQALRTKSGISNLTWNEHVSKLCSEIGEFNRHILHIEVFPTKKYHGNGKVILCS